MEWDYEYWRYYDNHKKKHHHAQTMAMNNALYQLKNISTYLLFVDLDEYIQCDSIPNIVQKHSKENIDIFIFHNQFCTMGHENIYYYDFYDVFDTEKIVEGNYWDKMREKLLIRTEAIYVMGVHEVYKHFSPKNLIDIHIGKFYHFVNFKEKSRDYLMTEYTLD
jgi:hypothetical protein